MVCLVQRLAWLGLLALIVFSVFSAVAANNAVDESGLSYASFQATANQLKPAQCDSLNLTSVIIGSGNINGGGTSLILGSSGNDTIKGKGGDDCILAGGGNDTLDGDAGNDVLLGGNGDDILSGDKGVDYCDGGPNTDTANDGTCETRISIEIWW